jgi:hypothetical protein
MDFLRDHQYSSYQQGADEVKGKIGQRDFAPIDSARFLLPFSGRKW